jgi:hypothetical protein
MVFPQLPGLAQSATPAGVRPTTTAPPYGIAAMRPVFAGACKACPWGVLGKVTADALRPYGYEVQNCWVCWSMYGPREMGDKTIPVMPPADDVNDPVYAEMPPQAVPDLSATMESLLVAAWNGTGPFAKDHKQRHNYRVIAVVRNTSYLMAAASKKSGITSLWQIKDRKEPTWIAAGPGGIDPDVFNYYGIKVEDLKAKGGGILPAVGPSPGQITREQRAAADVFIGGGLLVNTPEQRVWYEASQLHDLVFLDFDEALLAKLAQEPGAERVNIPLAILRGVDREIPSIVHPNTFIYARDDTPDSFAYAVAKALDEQRHLFREQMMAWYYDTNHVADSKVIPMHPGAMKYYRERGYVK